MTAFDSRHSSTSGPRSISTSAWKKGLLLPLLTLITWSVGMQAQTTPPTVSTLAATHGSIAVGGVVFSNFQAPAVLPFSHPQGALPNDANDIAVSASVAADGSVGITFTPIDPLTGAAKPLFINAQRGTPDPSNLVRNITFDVTATAANTLLHSITESHGPGSRSNADAGVASIGYYLEPGTGAAGLLVMDTLSPTVAVAPLPGGDLLSFRFGNELEMTSNHNRGGSVGAATVDSYTVSFALTSSNATPPASPTAVPSFVGANSILGGTTALGVLQLNVPAGAGGQSVLLTSTNPALVTVPASVLVPQGALTATFPMTAAPVVTASTVGLTANANAVQISGFVQVFPAPPLAVTSLSLNPAAVSGGATLGGLVSMNIPVNATPAVVTLSSGNPAFLTVPASVTIPVGSSSVSFVAGASPVGTAVNVPVSATYNGGSVTAVVTINPAPVNVYTVSIVRDSTGVVTGTPAGTNGILNCGNVCSVSFPEGSTVTLTATPARGKTFANWAGACSGSTPVCNFVVRGNTSVQAVYGR